MNAWTPERIEQLRTLRQDPNLTNKDIGGILGLTEDTVVATARRLGLGRRGSVNQQTEAGRARMRAIQRALSRHSPEKVERVRQLWENGLSYGGIGRVIGETCGVVAGIVTRNKFPRRDRPVGDQPWNEDEDAVLVGGVDEGLSHKEIALRLPRRTFKAVRNRCSLLGLSEEYRFRQEQRFRKRVEARRSEASEALAKSGASSNLIMVNLAQRCVVAKPMPLLRSLVCESVPLTHDHHGCQWITSDERPWTVCANRRQAGRSYCAGHYALSVGGYEPDEPDEALPMQEAA